MGIQVIFITINPRKPLIIILLNHFLIASELMKLQLAIVNPGWQVIHKMKLSKLVEKIGGQWIFLTVEEAVEACLGCKKDNASAC